MQAKFVVLVIAISQAACQCEHFLLKMEHTPLWVHPINGVIATIFGVGWHYFIGDFNRLMS